MVTFNGKRCTGSTACSFLFGLFSFIIFNVLEKGPEDQKKRGGGEKLANPILQGKVNNIGFQNFYPRRSGCDGFTVLDTLLSWISGCTLCLFWFLNFSYVDWVYSFFFFCPLFLLAVDNIRHEYRVS